MKNKHFYQIFKLKIKPWIKYWLIKQTEFKGVLSDILEGISFYLTDSLNMKFKMFKIYGRTTQESTTGDNLISSENIDAKVAGVTYKSQNDGTILANGTKYGGNYSNFTNNTVTLETDTYSSRIFLLDGTIKKDGNDYKPEIYLINQDDNTKSYSISEIGNPGRTKNIEAGTYFIRIALWNDNIVFTNAKIGLMLVKGSTIPTEFERYTGGEPAPNPNYPMAIKNTGDNGSVNEKVSNSDGTQEQNISFPLAQGQKLYQDEELKENEKDDIWSEYIFTGEENWTLYSETENELKAYSTGPRLGRTNNMESTKDAFCTHFKNNTFYSSTNGIGLTQNATYVSVSKTIASNVSELKSWFATQYTNETPVKVQYKKKNPTTTPYTEEQQQYYDEHIKPLRTYKPVTHISSEDETPALLKIQYWKEG